jgi:hypothetical protein
MLTQEKINSNFVQYVKRLEKYDCYSESLMNDLGEDIKNCSFSMNDDSGSAYQGSMVDVVLNVLCKIAYNINEKAFENEPNLKVNMNMLMRVLLLQHIAKAQMFVPQRESWKLKKGILYDFNDNLKAILKLGERTIFLCQKYGIKLNEEEYEALRYIDKTDDKADYMASPLCIIVKMANALTAIECKKRYQIKNKKETLED